MKQLLKLVQGKLKTWYYYQELKEISFASALITAVWFLYNSGEEIFRWMLTETGRMYVVFFMAGIVISITIKIYYRVMVIKYHEKDTHIELFKELESNR
ncbi:MAG: hypothetical protein IPP96_07585 [Chitinophagaceae bacterium]|nr:hypothetical protein [Chitinophagaceae bacterium]